MFKGKAGAPLLVDLVPPGGELYKEASDTRTYSGTYAVVNKGAKGSKKAAPQIVKTGGGKSGAPVSAASTASANRTQLATPTVTAAQISPGKSISSKPSASAGSWRGKAPRDTAVVGEREFKWYFPQREGGKNYWTILHGADAKIELYDKTGTVRKQYNAKKTMPRHTLRLSDCLALTEGKTPGKGLPCLMLTFKSKGTVCMAAAKDVLQEWLGLLHDHWKGDGGVSSGSDGIASGGGGGGAAAGGAKVGTVLAKFAFQATIKGQLSVARGEAVTVLNKVAAGGGCWEEVSKGWVEVQKADGGKGDVPSAYLEPPADPAAAPPAPAPASTEESPYTTMAHVLAEADAPPPARPAKSSPKSNDGDGGGDGGGEDAAPPPARPPKSSRLSPTVARADSEDAPPPSRPLKSTAIRCDAAAAAAAVTSDSDAPPPARPPKSSPKLDPGSAAARTRTSRSGTLNGTFSMNASFKKAFGIADATPAAGSDSVDAGAAAAAAGPGPGVGGDDETFGGFVSDEEDDIWGDWQLDRSQLVIQQAIGSGEYGEVHAGLLRGTGEYDGFVAKVAVKKLKQTDKSIDFFKEAKVMMNLRHQHLVNFYGVVVEDDPLLIVSELCALGCMKDYLKGPAGQAMEIAEMHRFLVEICSGMAHLEGQGYVHRDLAARNILLDENAGAKVADFGMSREVVEGLYEAQEDAVCPIRWTAPEAMHYGKFSIKSDMWSFGITACEVLARGADPYDGIPNMHVIRLLEAGSRMNKLATCNADLYELLLDAWEEDPDDRPTFAVLMPKLCAATKISVPDF